MKYRLSQLENGLRVATAEMPHMTSVSLGLWIGVGSRYEAPADNGACHFLEHLLFKGTRKRTAREISQAIEGIGGYLNAFTSEESTCFHARVGHDRFEDALEVLVDMLLHSKLAPVDILKERDVIKEEIAMYQDEPQHHVQEVLNSVLWPDQPLGRPITGTPETLDRLHRAELRDFLRRHYVAASTVLVAAGQVRHNQAVRAIAGRARFFAGGPRPRFEACRQDQSGPAIRLVTRKTEQTQLALGIRTCSRHDPRRFALRLLNTILGENMSSRLFQVVREERGLAYSIYSTPSYFADTGDLVISAGVDTDKLGRALKLILSELRRLTEQPPGASELRRARDYVIGQMELGREATENQMNWVGEQLLSYGRVFMPHDLKRRFMSVRPGEIRAVAQDFFRNDRLNLAMVSPLKNDAPARRVLRL